MPLTHIDLSTFCFKIYLRQESNPKVTVRAKSALEKTCLGGSDRVTQTNLLSYRDYELNAEMLCVLCASLSIILSSEGITKALVSLCRCSGRSVRLLFACNEVRFSRDSAQSNSLTIMKIIKQVSLY